MSLRKVVSKGLLSCGTHLWLEQGLTADSKRAQIGAAGNCLEIRNFWFSESEMRQPLQGAQADCGLATAAHLVQAQAL
jgi:hypothetical protein